MAKHKTLYIEIDDEITSVVEKLREAVQEEVTLVIPKGAVLLQSVVNLRLLKRISHKLNKKIAVVAADPTSRNLVSRAGIVLQHSVSDSFPEGAEKDLEEAPKPISSTLNIEAEGEGATKEKKIAVKGYAQTDDDTEEIQDTKETQRKKEIEQEIKKPNNITSRKPEKNLIRTSIGGAKKSETKDADRAQKIQAIRSRRTVGVSKSLLPKNFARFAILFGGIAAIVVVVVLMMTLPRATITIIPKTEPTSDTINVGIISSGNPSADLNQVAGKYIEATKQDSKNFPATGQKDFGKNATGNVSFSNIYSSSTSELLPAGTKLQTSGGKIYLLDAPVTIPPATVSGGTLIAGIATGKASAEKTGEAYNAGTTGLTILGLSATKQGKITAASSGFTGGSTDVKTVVSADDIAKAKTATEAEAQDQAKADLKLKVEAGQILQDQAIALKINESKSLVSQDAQASGFDYSVTVLARGITYDEKQVKESALTALSNKLQGQKTLLDSDTGNFAYSVKKFDADAKTLLIATTVQKKAVPNIDLSKAPQDLAGKTDSEIRGYFANIPEIDTIKVVFWPFWVKHAPGNASRTSIVLDTE
jgi:hypothetical protein